VPTKKAGTVISPGFEDFRFEAPGEIPSLTLGVGIELGKKRFKHAAQHCSDAFLSCKQ